MQLEEAERIDALKDDMRDVHRAFLARSAAHPDPAPLADARSALSRRLERPAYDEFPEEQSTEALARAALEIWARHLASQQPTPMES